jgi:predicted ATP-grasp superfamily ATP-dependent carboligase
MVRSVAESYSELKEIYNIDFSNPQLVLHLLNKENIPPFVEQAGLVYPETFVVSGIEGLKDIKDTLNYPILIKPTSPLSPFKAEKVIDENELLRFVGKYQKAVKSILIQEWITGTEKNIYFASFYLDGENNAIAKFLGRKIRSMPRNTGVTSSAEASNRTDILDSGFNFFNGLKLTGPVSIEIKESDIGNHYVIEPTVGRFDYWILCCVINGVDFPYLSYTYRINKDATSVYKQKKSRIWVDFERDLPVYIESFKIRGQRKDAIGYLFKKKTFALWAWDDIRPSLYKWPRGLKDYILKTVKIIKKLFF